jgi:hypothetical protein
MLIVGSGEPTSGQTVGPSTAGPVFVLPHVASPGVQTVAILSAGNAIGGYKMVGVPDGMGLFDNGDGNFTVLLNHELTTSQGGPHAHGASAGAFVSKWVIRKPTGVPATDWAVQSGVDLIQSTVLVNGTSTFGRFCSGDLPVASALSDGATGSTQRIYMNAEENGTSGRACAHVVTGSSAGVTYDLPRMGRMNFENAVACPASGLKTIVCLTDDTAPGQVYIYVGTKDNAGATEPAKAGLTNGNLYGVKVTGLLNEIPSTGLPGGAPQAFIMHNFGNVTGVSGATLETTSNSNGVLRFARPEDSAWDPSNPSDLYFATTGGSTGTGTAPGRLWRLRFADIANPETGGVLSLMLDGTEGMSGPDNITVDPIGRIMINEDTGSLPLLSRTWAYDILTDQLQIVVQSSFDYFVTQKNGGNAALSTPEEHSGVTHAFDAIGQGWYLLDCQSHYNVADPVVVQEGQLLAMYVPPALFDVPGDMNCDGRIDTLDIEPFILALLSASDYALAYPLCEANRADIDSDSLLDGTDVGPFTDLLLP